MSGPAKTVRFDTHRDPPYGLTRHQIHFFDGVSTRQRDIGELAVGIYDNVQGRIGEWHATDRGVIVTAERNELG